MRILVWAMARCRTGDKPLPEPMLITFFNWSMPINGTGAQLTHWGLTRYGSSSKLLLLRKKHRSDHVPILHMSQQLSCANLWPDRMIKSNITEEIYFHKISLTNSWLHPCLCCVLPTGSCETAAESNWQWRMAKGSLTVKCSLLVKISVT